MDRKAWTPIRRHKILLCGFFLVVIFAPMGFAAPRLKLEPPPKQIAIDQNVRLKVQLEWPATEGPYEINSLEPKLENLTLEKQNQSQETGSSVLQTITYEFRPLKKGSAVIYPFEVSFRKTETEPWIPILIPEQKIKVVSSLPLRSILIGMGIAVGISAAIYAGFKSLGILKARVTTRNVPFQDPKQRLYAKAEESIATFASPDSKKKLTNWSNQLRAVLVTYYDISSKAATREEVLSSLKKLKLPAGDWNEISRLFDQLSEMQFSRQDTPTCELDRIQKTLLQYVNGKIIIGH